MRTQYGYDNLAQQKSPHGKDPRVQQERAIACKFRVFQQDEQRKDVITLLIQ
jgi:hypothetical protein